MGTWSAQPFGNDDAADWAAELDDADDWDVVRTVLEEAASADGDELDADEASVAIAAAEVVARGLGRPTQSDAHTESAAAFVERVGAPPAELRALALRAIDVAADPAGELTELWEDGDPAGWAGLLDRLREALGTAA